jgi:hypothetical protein
MSKEKLARRKAAGDDPTAKSQSNATNAGAPPAQPNPGAPQGAGNIMNNPMNGMSMGGGMPQPGGPGMYPYMDGGIGPQDPRNGTVGFTQPSGMPEFIVPGLKNNAAAPYNMQQQPKGETQMMMGPMYAAQQAGERSAKLNGQETPPPYQVTPMGMSGFDLDTAQAAGYVNPGQIPGQAPQQMFNVLGLQGMNDAQMAATLGMGPDNGGMVPGSTPQKIQKKGGKK